jgi:hypothetical protein
MHGHEELPCHVREPSGVDRFNGKTGARGKSVARALVRLAVRQALSVRRPGTVPRQRSPWLFRRVPSFTLCPPTAETNCQRYLISCSPI